MELFPDNLKIAKVVPIHKKDDKSKYQITDQFLSPKFFRKYMKNLGLCTLDQTFRKLWVATHWWVAKICWAGREALTEINKNQIG